MSVLVGTSGWQYADWRGRFYPQGLAQKAWLRCYAETFPTVEVNATFYRLPTRDAASRWADQVPSDFTMAIKASRYLTHITRLRDPAEPVARLLDRIEPLRDRGLLGPILVQLPPDLQVEPERLDRTLQEVPRDVRVAVEPRHKSWFHSEVRDVLERRRAALVWSDRMGLAQNPLWQTASWSYLRLHHGRNRWGYDRRDLARWARRLKASGEGYAYCNNDPGGAAVRDARTLTDLLS